MIQSGESRTVIINPKDAKLKHNGYNPPYALIFGTGPLAPGLFGFELAKAGYTLAFADAHNRMRERMKKEKRYRVNIGQAKYAICIDDVIDIADKKALAEKTRETGLVLVVKDPHNFHSIWSVLENALYDGYTWIEKSDRHILNILACHNSYHPASILRSSIHHAWLRRRDGHYLVDFGVSGMRITNVNAERTCIEKDGVVKAEIPCNWIVEETIWTDLNSSPNTQVFQTRSNLEKAKQQRRAYARVQFLGRVQNLPFIRYVDNIEYYSLFAKKK
jgi:hypothetical protein